MAELLALLVLSITSENLLKIHSRTKTQTLYKRLKAKDPMTACTSYQHEIYCTSQKECVTMITIFSGPPHLYTPHDLGLAVPHKGIYLEIWKSLQAM